MSLINNIGSWFVSNKANFAFALIDIGGVDGTRTRDPRRDRPVF